MGNFAQAKVGYPLQSVTGKCTGKPFSLCSTLPTLTLILCKVAGSSISHVSDREAEQTVDSFSAPVVVRPAGSSEVVEVHLRSGAACCRVQHSQGIERDEVVHHVASCRAHPRRSA
jgi:hypothetical protein